MVNWWELATDYINSQVKHTGEQTIVVKDDISSSLDSDIASIKGKLGANESSVKAELDSVLANTLTANQRREDRIGGIVDLMISEGYDYLHHTQNTVKDHTNSQTEALDAQQADILAAIVKGLEDMLNPVNEAVNGSKGDVSDWWSSTTTGLNNLLNPASGWLSERIQDILSGLLGGMVKLILGGFSKWLEVNEETYVEEAMRMYRLNQSVVTEVKKQELKEGGGI